MAYRVSSFRRFAPLLPGVQNFNGVPQPNGVICASAIQIRPARRTMGTCHVHGGVNQPHHHGASTLFQLFTHLKRGADDESIARVPPSAAQ